MGVYDLSDNKVEIGEEDVEMLLEGNVVLIQMSLLSRKRRPFPTNEVVMNLSCETLQ